MNPYDQYETVIGLEVHVQLSTKSKAFCADATTFGAAPNSQVSVVSLGHPGTLPRLNERQLEYAIKLGLALGSEISRQTTFDRKNYFYADLPKGYQITQDQTPVCIGGELPIYLKNGERKVIRFHHVHMEEDAGKSIHRAGDPYSLVDLNRAGVPLLEMVTEPDLRSPEEVDALMTAVRRLVRYLGISDGNMEEGSLRCDCNISVRKKGSKTLGQRCEVKNMNSMRFARRAIEFERKRQIDLIEAGGEVQQQTLQFDPVSGRTSPLRSKEDAHDYRYFPEPDLPPVIISEAQIETIRSGMPATPEAVIQQLQSDYQLNDYDARIIFEEKEQADYFLRLAAQTPHAKPLANLLINKIFPYWNEQQINATDFAVPDAHIISFLAIIESKAISHSQAYQTLLPALLEQPDQHPQQLIEALNLSQTDDADLLESLIEETLDAQPDELKKYLNGKKGLFGFFIGEVMRKSKGKANPQRTRELLTKALDQRK